MFGYSKEAVRVKVKKCEGQLQPEVRKFSVDPQITSLDVLQSILVKAFDIKSDFILSYRTVDDYGQEAFLPLLSDWELDAAFLKTYNIAVSQKSEPCVHLKVDMKPFSEALEDWEPPVVASPQIAQPHREQPTVTIGTQQSEKQELQTRFQGLIMNQVEKTFNMVTRALNLYEDPNTPPRPPLSDNEFRSFLDAVGHIANPTKLRDTIYCGGIDPSLRKVVWKHILNVYPNGMTGRERMDYIKRKANEYYTLRSSWKDCIQKGMVNSELTYVTGMVKKDVLRTDRHHEFYAGSDDNQNIASLFNILTTYALNHPSVSYCQGMSDLASPLLVTMSDEAHAYICLCALMTRLRPNFLLDGEAMTLKFSHLTESLQVYDPEFYNYLKMHQADDLLFCYRWLLLEMKREFAFDDALRMLEVLWASLPQKPTLSDLPLIEQQFYPTMELNHGDPPPLSPLVKTHRENAYTKVCAIRRQSSSFSLANVKPPKLSTCKQMNHSLDENTARKRTTHISLNHGKDFQSLDDAALQLQKPNTDICNADEETNDKIKRRYVNTFLENGEDLRCQDPEDTSSSKGNFINKPAQGTPLGNQIRMLRDKISLHNYTFSSSLEKLDSNSDIDPAKTQVKAIKDLNKFLNLTTGVKKSGIQKQDKLVRANSAIVRSSPNECQTVPFTKTSFDENDLHAHTLRDIKPLNITFKSSHTDLNDGSSPDDSQEYYPMTTSMTRELKLEMEHLDRQVFGQSYVNQCSASYDGTSESAGTNDKQLNVNYQNLKQNCEVKESEIQPEASNNMNKNKSPFMYTVKSSAKSLEDIYVWENPLHKNIPNAKVVTSCPPTPEEQAELDFDCDNGEIFEEKSITPIRLLKKNFSFEPQDSLSDTVDSKLDCSEKDQSKEDNTNISKSHKFFSSMSQELENAKKNCESLLNNKQTSNINSVAATINNFQKKYEVFKPPSQKNVAPTLSTTDVPTKNTIAGLPPPSTFGGGNPFLMYLCLTVLMQHRDYIMRNHMDYNELAMHFDKMVRKHNVNRVLNQAREMYAIYLKQQTHKTNDITT